MRARRLTGALAVATLATVWVSLGPTQAFAASNTVDPATYVHSVCSALSTYQTELNALHDAEGRSNGSSLADTRDRLVTFLTQATTATQTAVTELQAAGAPSIKNGDKMAALIVKEVTAVRDAFIKAGDSAHALSTSDRSAFQREIDAVGKQIDAAGKKAGRTLGAAKKRFNTKVLNAVQSKDPTCNGER
jgi:hypothetical protein